MAMQERPEHVGDHYKTTKIDTWDFIDANFTPIMRYGFYAGNAIKYLQRAHMKGGLEDIKKASHYQSKVDELLKQFPDLLTKGAVWRTSITFDERPADKMKKEYDIRSKISRVVEEMNKQTGEAPPNPFSDLGTTHV